VIILGAVLCIRCFEISLVDPGVGSVLYALLDGQCSVIGAGVHYVRMGVVYGRPQDGPTLLGRHGHPELRKLCTTSLFDIVEVHVERKGPHAARAFSLVLVMSRTKTDCQQTVLATSERIAAFAVLIT